MENENSHKRLTSGKNSLFTKENAKEMGKRGGSKKSSKKKLAASLRNIRRCSKKCPLYPCPYMTLSFSDKLNGKCALKELPYRIQKRIVRFYLKGEIGIIEELKEVLSKIAEKSETEGKRQALREYYKDIMGYIKTVYGEKNRLDGSIEHNLGTADIVRIIKRSRNESTS